MLRRLLRDETGAAGVEYGILLAAVSAGIIGVAFTIGEHVHDAMFEWAMTWQNECRGWTDPQGALHDCNTPSL